MTKPFTQTSDKSYDRHDYVLVNEDGTRTKFQDYIQLRDFWMINRGVGMSHVEVVDVSKGFA